MKNKRSALRGVDGRAVAYIHALIATPRLLEEVQEREKSLGHRHRSAQYNARQLCSCVRLFSDAGIRPADVRRHLLREIVARRCPCFSVQPVVAQWVRA